MDKKTLEIQIKLLANKALQQVKEFGDDIKNTADKAKGFTGDATKIATSIKSMQDAAKRTANQMKLFGMSSSDLRNTTQNLKKTILDLTEAGLKPESQEIQKLVEQYKELESQADRVEASEQGIFGVIGKLKNEIGSLAAVAAAVKIDKAVAGLASSTLEVNNSFQKIRDDFGIMLGDVEAGIGLFNELQEFNFWTPFDIEQTSQAAKVLVSAKVQLKDLTSYLTRFGDIAQGDAQKFQSYINAFSKASAKGKADMEVLNVFTDQGVQILDALGQQLGKSSAEIVKMASEGKISFQNLDDALKAMASEGGLYYGTLEKAAMRLDAVQAGLDESVKSLKASFGEMLAPAISKVLTAFTAVVDYINSSPIVKGIVAAAIVAVTVAVNGLALVAIVKLVAGLKTASLAMTAIGASSKIAAVGVAGLGTAINAALPIIGAISIAVGLVTAAVVAEKSAHQKAAEAAAEHAKQIKQLDQNYQDYLDNVNAADAARELEKVNREIIAQQRTLERLEQQKSSTPQKISKMQNGYKYETSNPEYEKIEGKLKSAESEMDRLQKRAEQIQEKISQLNEKAAESAQAKVIENAQKMGTEWQDKLDAQIEGIEAQRKKSIEKLQKHASEIYAENYKNEESYRKELAALNKYYDDKKADEAKKQAEKEKAELEKKLAEQKAAIEKTNEEIRSALSNVSEWVHSDDSEIEKIEAEYRKSIDSINKDFDVLIRNGVATETDCIKAVANIRKHYDQQIADARKKAQAEYWQKEAEKASKQLREGNINGKNIARYTGATTMSALQESAGETDFGSLFTGLSALTSAISSVVAAFVKCLLEIENVSKILNWAGTIIEKVFEYIGPIINDILAPLVELMETVGETIGQILTPLFAVIQILTMLSGLTIILKVLSAILQVVGGAFEWLYNKIIVPVGNKFIDIINSIITALNKIPWVNLSKLDNLKYIGEKAEEIAEETAKTLEMVKKRYERMKSAVESILESQLDALKSQYELGLISRAEYERQAEKYAAEADSKIYDINKEMEDTLEVIENGTVEIADVLKEQGIGTSSDLEHMKMYTPNGAILPGGNAIHEWDSRGLQFGGSLKSSLSVNVTVQGSVVTEQKLVDSVYQGIAKGIQSNRYNALGAA